MEYKWKESIDIPDGKHEGEVTKLEERTEPYQYTDIFIKPDGHDVEIKYGCPSVLTPNSKLGRLVVAFGFQPVKDQVITTDELKAVFVGKRVEFMTLKKKSSDGKEFSEVISESVKLLA